jgi:ABC-type glycerol-3-phosphate transport system substrate-binding protein
MATLFVLLLGGCTACSKLEQPAVAFFYWEDCGHCARMMKVLLESFAEHPGLAVRYYNLSKSANENLLQRLATRYRLQRSPDDVPVIFVGDTAIVGEGTTQELALRAAIAACASGDCHAPVR